MLYIQYIANYRDISCLFEWRKGFIDRSFYVYVIEHVSMKRLAR